MSTQQASISTSISRLMITLPCLEKLLLTEGHRVPSVFMQVDIALDTLKKTIDSLLVTSSLSDSTSNSHLLDIISDMQECASQGDQLTSKANAFISRVSDHPVGDFVVGPEEVNAEPYLTGIISNPNTPATTNFIVDSISRIMSTLSHLEKYLLTQGVVSMEVITGLVGMNDVIDSLVKLYTKEQPLFNFHKFISGPAEVGIGDNQNKYLEWLNSQDKKEEEEQASILIEQPDMPENIASTRTHTEPFKHIEWCKSKGPYKADDCDCPRRGSPADLTPDIYEHILGSGSPIKSSISDIEGDRRIEKIKAWMNRYKAIYREDIPFIEDSYTEWDEGGISDTIPLSLLRSPTVIEKKKHDPIPVTWEVTEFKYIPCDSCLKKDPKITWCPHAKTISTTKQEEDIIHPSSCNYEAIKESIENAKVKEETLLQPNVDKLVVERGAIIYAKSRLTKAKPSIQDKSIGVALHWNNGHVSRYICDAHLLKVAAFSGHRLVIYEDLEDHKLWCQLFESVIETGVIKGTGTRNCATSQYIHKIADDKRIITHKVTKAIFTIEFKSDCLWPTLIPITQGLHDLDLANLSLSSQVDS